MKTLRKLFGAFVTGVLVLGLIGSSPANAQVTLFPYSYEFEIGGFQDPISGDGDWTSEKSQGNTNHWTQSASGGNGGSGGAAFLDAFTASGKFSRLRVHLNTSAATTPGGEFWSFSILRDGSGSETANSTTEIIFEYSTDGVNYTVLSDPEPLSTYVPAANVYVPQVVFLPPEVLGLNSVYLAIKIKAGTGQSSDFDNIYVDDSFIGGGALPIQLASAAAYVLRDNDVEVTWRTVSETNNYGFEIHRRRGDSGAWTTIAFVEGHGTTLEPQSYSYLDRSVGFGQYYYRIQQIDLDGTSETFPEMAVTVGVAPEKFILAQNYPNPFNPSTLIEFVVPVSGYATVKVYNVLGQEVATLFEGNADAGKIHTVRFNASSLSSGLYFYALRSDGRTETKRMLLTK